MHWSTREIRYLEEHAHEGARAIAFALGRSTESVKQQAKRFGISLRKRWFCPKCCHWSRRPLSSRTGWCVVCTKAHGREKLEEEVREMREEMRREQKEDRSRQALYSQKSRLKKRHENDTTV